MLPISADKHTGLEPLVAAISAELRDIETAENAGRMSQLDYKQAVLKGAKRVVIKVGSAVLSDVSGLDAAVICGWPPKLMRRCAAGARLSW